MPKDDFNKDLDSYIKQRKGYGGRFFNFSFPEVKPGEAEILVQEATGDDDFSEEEVKLAMEGKLEAGQSMQSKKKQSFFSRIFGSSGRQSDDYYMNSSQLKYRKGEDSKALPPDAAEVLTIAGKWLNRLEPDVKREFKESSDYQKYRIFIERLKKQ